MNERAAPFCHCLDVCTSFFLNSTNFISGPGRSLSPDKEAMNDPKRRN